MTNNAMTPEEKAKVLNWIYAISGRLHIRMDDGTEQEVGPGEAMYVPPGHDAWVVGNEPFVAVDFTGMKEFAAATSSKK